MPLGVRALSFLLEYVVAVPLPSHPLVINCGHGTALHLTNAVDGVYKSALYLPFPGPQFSH